jgi:hypothetical protein
LALFVYIRHLCLIHDIFRRFVGKGNDGHEN